MRSNCNISFYRNDLQKTRLQAGKCPVKNCSVKIGNYEVPFNKRTGRPFCPEHGIRLHNNGFVYYNGSSKDDLSIATIRNLPFQSDYYLEHFLKKGVKMESGRLCYESSEDAVSYNVFAEMLSDASALKKLVSHITNKTVKDEVELYLWGGHINLRHNKFSMYKPLIDTRKHLEHDIRRFSTEPDIMLVVPGKTVICIEAKFGSKNPTAKDKEHAVGEKPKKQQQLIERYCRENQIIDTNTIFDFSNMPKLFYEQLFRNIVFAASMAKLSNAPEWYVVNLRNQHVMNLKKGKAESMPIMRNMRSILQPKYKKRFTHLTWEEIYDVAIKGNENLCNLTWYMKNKSLNCARAFNVI